MILGSLRELETQGKLNQSIVLWGIGNRTREVIAWLRDNGHGHKLILIVDNFKHTFFREYEAVPVAAPSALDELEKDSFLVLLSINHAEDVWRQLSACGVTKVYNLRNLTERILPYQYNIPFHFTDRGKGKKYLCYVLAGYEQALWKNTLGRLETFQDSEVDYCLVLSGRRDEILEEMAERNGWSYLYTEINQVCYIQNLVIDLHPFAQYILKIDEDIFIGKDFFRQMIRGYHHAESDGEYRVGFVVPVVPLNCCGYASYLELISRKDEYEKRFGRAYKNRFSAVFSLVETAEFLWDTMDTFDNMAERFLENTGYDILDCYYNIGCIMFSRERWMMMGKWPEFPDESGMGRDEAYICRDNANKDLAIYELKNVLAGHLAFGHQKKRMMEYYKNHPEKFRIKTNR